MQMAEIADYAARTFLDTKGSGLPSPEVAQGIVFTAASFMIGWLASRGGSQRRLKARVINELILSQSELKSRAWPKVWRMNDLREAWMLDPFVARLRFLYASLEETKSLSSGQMQAIQDYIARVTEFIEKWEDTQVRRDGYRYAFDQTYQALRFATRKLGLRETKRLVGLSGPTDELFSGLLPTSSATQEPPAPSGLSIVPAE